MNILPSIDFIILIQNRSKFYKNVKFHNRNNDVWRKIMGFSFVKDYYNKCLIIKINVKNDNHNF